MTALHARIARTISNELLQGYVTQQDADEALAAAIINDLREDRFAIVNLPEPTMDVQPYGVQWRAEDWWVYRDDDVVVAISTVGLTPTAAREYAAGLLAAADATESGAE